MTPCEACALRQEDPDTSEAEAALAALARKSYTAPACFKGCEAIFRFIDDSLVTCYKVACGHVCEIHPHDTENHQCCLCVEGFKLPPRLSEQDGNSTLDSHCRSGV